MARAWLLLVALAASTPLVRAADLTFDDPHTAGRMMRLEAETAALRAEVARLRDEPTRLPSVDGVVPASMQTPVAPAPPAPAFPSTVMSPAPLAPDEADYFTLDELKAEMKKLAWRKGDFTITPYAWLWATAVYETERSAVGDYTLYVLSAQDQGESAFHMDARGSRVGFDVLGPRICFFDNAQSGGKLEIDFHGQFVTENKSGVLLRHAYWEVKNEDFRLLAGQTWDIISPLNPNTIMYSIYWGAGNIGYRRAQFRGERYFSFSDCCLLTFQGSINANIVSDIASAATPGFSGDHSAWPVLQGRTAFTFGDRGKGGRPVTLGVSGHIGEQVYDFTAAPAQDDVYLRTWSTCVDLRAPITDRFGFQGEYFMGQNLGTYLGGILQGVDVGNRRSIYSHGGWISMWYDLTPRLHSQVGYTIDDPLDADLSSASSRTYNSAYWGGFLFDITKQFTTGIELSSWRTLYRGKTPGESVRLEVMAKYTF
jgi:hypothetical protein